MPDARDHPRVRRRAAGRPGRRRRGPAPPRRLLPGPAGEAEPHLRGVGQAEWLDRLQAEAGNLAAAVDWYLSHDRAPLPHLFRALLPYWLLASEILGQARAWIGQLLPAAGALDPQARAELLWAAAATANQAGDGAAALAASQQLEPLLAVSLAAYSTQNVTLVLAAFAGLAFAEEDLERAALLAGAVDGLRRELAWRCGQRWAGKRLIWPLKSARHWGPTGSTRPTPPEPGSTAATQRPPPAISAPVPGRPEH